MSKNSYRNYGPVEIIRKFTNEIEGHLNHIYGRVYKRVPWWFMVVWSSCVLFSFSDFWIHVFSRSATSGAGDVPVLFHSASMFLIARFRQIWTMAMALRTLPLGFPALMDVIQVFDVGLQFCWMLWMHFSNCSTVRLCIFTVVDAWSEARFRISADVNTL